MRQHNEGSDATTVHLRRLSRDPMKIEQLAQCIGHTPQRKHTLNEVTSTYDA